MVGKGNARDTISDEERLRVVRDQDCGLTLGFCVRKLDMVTAGVLVLVETKL